MQENTVVVPFFARKANERGLTIRTGIKAGAREEAMKITESRNK